MRRREKEEKGGKRQAELREKEKGGEMFMYEKRKRAGRAEGRERRRGREIG